MIQDLNLRMDYQLTLTTTGQSNFVIDTLAAGDAMDTGDLPLWKVICYTTPVASFGTITFTLQTCANSLFDSNAVTLMQTAALDLTLIKAQTANIAPPGALQGQGTQLGPILVAARLPIGCLQYIRTGYAIGANAGFTSIGLTSEIVLDTDKLLGSQYPGNLWALIK